MKVLFATVFVAFWTLLAFSIAKADCTEFHSDVLSARTEGGGTIVDPDIHELSQWDSMRRDLMRASQDQGSCSNDDEAQFFYLQAWYDYTAFTFSAARVTKQELITKSRKALAEAYRYGFAVDEQDSMDDYTTLRAALKTAYDNLGLAWAAPEDPKARDAQSHVGDVAAVVSSVTGGQSSSDIVKWVGLVFGGAIIGGVIVFILMSRRNQRGAQGKT